jgi:Mn2+/Fe2+ NRAMP family transporter
LCPFGIGTLLQVAAAATLLPLGIKPRSAEHLVRLFSESMGVMGKVIFGVGLWGICFSSFVGGTMGYSLIVRDICRRFVPRLRVAADSSTISQPSRHDPVYRWSVAFLGLSPLYIVFLGVEPVALTLVVRSMVVIVIPVLVGSLMKMANNRTLMGEHRPGLFSNAVMALLVVVSVYLTARDSGEWWHTLVR